jgi:hypothetical protein
VEIVQRERTSVRRQIPLDEAAALDPLDVAAELDDGPRR